MANQKKYEVSTLFRVTESSAKLAQDDDVNWPGVPFRAFQLAVEVNNPVYDPGTYAVLTNLDGAIRDYLLPGAVVKFISNIATVDLAGNLRIDEEYVLVRLIYARSAEEHIVAGTGEVVYPEIQTGKQGFDEFAFVNDYVGLIKRKYLESFIMDPSSIYNELQKAVQKEETAKKISKVLLEKPTYTLKNLKGFWWLPITKEQKHRNKSAFNRNNLVSQFPEQGIVWDSTKTYKVKIMEYATYNDDTAACGDSPSSRCPLALVAVIDADNPHNFAHNWANTDDQSTHLPQEGNAGDKVTPYAKWGYVHYSFLKAAIDATGDLDIPNDPPASSPTTPSSDPNSPPDVGTVESASDFIRDEKKCKYFVNIRARYKGTIEQLKNDNQFNVAVKMEAFSKLLQNYSKIAAFDRFVWMNKGSGSTLYGEKEKKILNQTYSKIQIVDTKKVGSNGEYIISISVPAALFDQIPDGPSLKPYVSQNASDKRCTLFIKKEGASFEDIITSGKDPGNYITLRFSLSDVEELGDTFVNVFHRRYVSEYKKYVDLLYADFQMESDYLLRFISGLRKLAKDNNLDIISSPTKHAHFDIIFDQNFLIKDVIYNKSTPFEGEYYQFKVGAEGFKSKNNNKSTNKLIHDLCSSSALNDSSRPKPEGSNAEKASIAADTRTRFLNHMQILHRTWSRPPSSECLARYSGKDTFDAVPIVFNNNDFFNQFYNNPKPKVKMKTKPSTPRSNENFTEIATFRVGPKSPADRAKEDRSINAMVQREGKELKKTSGSIFSEETNKYVGDLVKSKSVFTMILRSETFFGPKGLYQQLLNKTNLNVWLKSVLECAGYDLKGDDMFEVLCNIVLKNLPWDKIRDEVLMNLNEATGEVTDWTTKALEDIYAEMSTEDFDLNKATAGLGDVLRFADPKWYPGFDQTTKLANSLNVGNTPVSTPESGQTLGGSAPPLKCDDLDDDLVLSMIPGAALDSNATEDNVPYLATPNDAAANSKVYSSGDAVYKWKVFLNYKLSTAPSYVVTETIKYAFTEEEFVKNGSSFNEKTKLATQEYTRQYRWSVFESGTKDALGIQGIVSLEAFREATKWWALTPRAERDKYVSNIVPGTIESTSRITVDNLEKLLGEMPIKFAVSPATVTQLFNNHYLVIKRIISQREISGTPTITGMVTLSLASKSSMIPSVNSSNIIMAELMMAPVANAQEAIYSKINDFVGVLKPNLEDALNRFGIVDYSIEELTESESMNPTDFDQMVEDTNQETGEIVQYQSFLSQPQVPTDFQSFKTQLDGYISAGAFSKEGQIRLVNNLVNNYNLEISALVTAHCNPEFLCKHLEKYILDLMAFFDTGDLSKIGLGKVSDFFKNFNIEDFLGNIGKLWVAAILKQIDQSLLMSFKWLARYIQLNCELMMSEAGKAIMEEVNKLDDGFAKDASKFGLGLFNLDTEPDPEEAENIIQIVFPAQAIGDPSVDENDYEFQGVDKFRVDDDKYDKIDVNKTKMLREARKFIEIITPKDKQVIEQALQEIQSFLYRILLSHSSKKLVALFSGNANSALLEEMLLLIQNKYPSLNKVLDSVSAINSFFNFVGASVDLELFINSVVSRKIIEDSCEIKELSEDLQVLSSKAILALEEQNRIRNQYISKIADMAIDNGALSGVPNTLSVDHDLVAYPDSIPFLDNAMATARDTIMDSIEESYRSDIRNIRSIFMKFDISLKNEETGDVFDGFSELAGSLAANGDSAADVFDSYLNALADYTKGDSEVVQFGNDNYKIEMGFEEELYPELQDSLRGKKEFFIDRVYKIAAVNGPNSPNEQRLDIFPFLDYLPEEFEKFYNSFIEPKENNAGIAVKPNANFAFVMGINTQNTLQMNEYESGLATINYDTYVVLDPFKNHATMTSVVANTADGKYTTAVINNENVMFSWQSGMYTNPAELFGTAKVKTFTYGDPCSLDDLTIPYEVFEEINFKNQSDDAFPEIKDPLLGNIAENLPLDLKDFDSFTNTLPQARMFSKYVMNIFYKNIFEQKRGVYASMPDNLAEKAEKVRSILETYVFPRVTNNIIRSFGEYTSNSRYFNTKEVYKLTETLCDPSKIPFDLIDLGKIKDDLLKRYTQHRKKLLIDEQTTENYDAPSNGAFELAMMEGAVRLIIRTYLAELLLRAVFLFDRYIFAEIMDNEMFKELFAKQFLAGLQTYIGNQDPEIFRAMFLTECRYIVKTTWDSTPSNLKKYTKKQVLNDETTMIKHLVTLEINDIGAKINSLFSLDNEKIKPLKEIFFDDLKFGFLRNSGISYGTDTTPTSYFMFDYSNIYNAKVPDPIAKMSKKDQMTIDQASKQGFAELQEDSIYFDVNGNEISYEGLPDGIFPEGISTEFKLGFGDFVIEPYVRLVDWEVGEKENIDAESPNMSFPLTMFDESFGEGGQIEKDFGITGYVREDKYRGILALRDLQDFAIDLMDHLVVHDQINQEENPNQAGSSLQNFGKHELPLSTFYKELKWGIRLNLIIPADPYSGENKPFAKLEEVFNSFFSSSPFENRWVPGIHKSYRIWRQPKDVKGKPSGKKVPYFVIPLTYEEVEANQAGEGNGLIGFATNLYNQSFKKLAAIKPKDYDLQLARYIKYPSDEDVYKIKFNMGYRDEAYELFEEGTTAGEILPILIHSEDGTSISQKKYYEGPSSVERELIKHYHGKDILEDGSIEQKYLDLTSDISYEQALYDDSGGDGNFAAIKNIDKIRQDVEITYKSLLTTKYARNQFAQWMGIGVELDEEPYTRTQTKINKIERDTTRPDYHPLKTPELVGRPDFNAKFIIDYASNDDLYPHGAINDIGCKKTGYNMYQKIFAGNGTGYLSYIDNLETMYQAPADDGIGGGYGSIEYEDNGKYDSPPLYDTNFRNMSIYKMTRCQKSPSWKQVGAVYPNGEQIKTISEPKTLNTTQTLSPLKISINDIFPAEKYHWSQVVTDNQETFVNSVLSALGSFNYSSVAIDECIDLHLPGFDPDKPFDSKQEYESWKQNNEQNITNFFECVNNKLQDKNLSFENIYKAIEYKHPGGMPLPISVRPYNQLAGSGHDFKSTPDMGNASGDTVYKMCAYSGIFANNMFKDCKSTQLYEGAGSSFKKIIDATYDFKDDFTDIKIVADEEDENVTTAGDYFNKSNVSGDSDVHPDNINFLHGQSTLAKYYDGPWLGDSDHFEESFKMNFWGYYLGWSPGLDPFDSKSNKTIPGMGPAGSLEPSQIWVKNADSIDFRELANKKTDYLLERAGFVPSYYAGYKQKISLNDFVQKEFPVFDAVSHTYIDEDEDNFGVQSKSSMVSVLRSDADVYIDDLSGNWHDNDNIKDLPKTPSDRLKYPRSKLDVWRVKIKRNDGLSIYHPDYSITEQDIYDGKVDVIYDKYLKGPSGEVTKETKKELLNINQDMLMSYENSMFRKSTDPNEQGKLEEQPPLFLEDDSTWGGDQYIGLFPAAEDLDNLRALIQAIHIGKNDKDSGQILDILNLGYNPDFAGAKSDWVQVNSTGNKKINAPILHDDADKTSYLGAEIIDLLSGGGDDREFRSLINPLILNQGPGFGTFGAGYKWTEHTKQKLASLSSVESVLESSNMYYISAGLGQKDPFGFQTITTTGMELGDLAPSPSYYAEDYDDLPPDLKQYYVKTKSGELAGKPAIELKVKMKKSNYIEYAGGPNDPYYNEYIPTPDENGEINFTIKLYQVRLRSANTLKLGDIEFGAKMEIQELIQDNDGSVFIREFFVGDLKEKQQQEAAGNFNDITSIYEYLKDKMLYGPDGKGSKQFQLLFNYIFPLKQYASFIAVYTLFYSLYKKGSAFDTNEKMKRLFTNTKIDLFDLFQLLSTGGDPYKRFGISNLEENIVNTRNAEVFKQNGEKGLSAFEEKQNQILQQLRAEGLDPGFFALFGAPTDRASSGTGDDNIRIVFEVLASLVDPGFDTFPITPFGWIALLLRRRDRELAGKAPEPIPGEFIDPKDAELCKDE